MESDWLTTKQVEEYAQVSRQFLYEHRDDGIGPPYYRLGRNIRYKRAELDEWIARQRCPGPSVSVNASF